MGDNDRPSTKGKHTPRLRPGVVAAEARRTEALRLRAEGLTFREIAARLEVDVATSFRDCRDALAELRAENVELAGAVLTLELDRLDRVQAAHWHAALAGDCRAAGMVLRVMERRARLLGLDAPQKIAPTDPTGENPYFFVSDDELRALAREVLEGTPHA